MSAASDVYKRQVKYDNAIQTSGASGGGVGTAIGRSVAAIASTTGAS